MSGPEMPVKGAESFPELTPAELAAIQERKKLRINGYITLLTDPNLNYRWRGLQKLWGMKAIKLQ